MGRFIRIANLLPEYGPPVRAGGFRFHSCPISASPRRGLSRTTASPLGFEENDSRVPKRILGTKRLRAPSDLFVRGHFPACGDYDWDYRRREEATPTYRPGAEFLD